MPVGIAPARVRRVLRPGRAMALVLCAAVPVFGLALPAFAQSSHYADNDLRAGIAKRADRDLREFYASRGNRPLWIDGSGQVSPAARTLLDQIDTADFDGLNRKKLKPGDLAKAIERAEWGGTQDAIRAELSLSRAFAAYVKGMRAAPRAAMIYESEALAPVVPTSASALSVAAAAPSLDGYVRAMGWMHPFYAPLREALIDPSRNEPQRRQVALNLARVRALPAMAAGRYVLVDAAGARLWTYEDGRVTDTMKVVVGKPEAQTPMMAGFIRYAIINPYWNIPDDLMPSRVVQPVLAHGVGHLTAQRLQILDGWNDDAKVLDPRKVNWRAVAAGTQTIRARQLPGAANFMGRVKFMFPNPQGIYLHDTPEREYLAQAARQHSSGCVRLEDAGRLGRWLMGKPLPRGLKDPEQRLELPEVVPVYLTYLTAMPENGQIAFRSDVYGRDGVQLAAR